MVAPGDRSPHRVALTLPGASELTFAMEGADGTLWLAARSHVCRDGSRLISIDSDDLMSVLNRNARASMSFLKLLSARQQGMLAKISGA